MRPVSRPRPHRDRSSTRPRVVSAASVLGLCVLMVGCGDVAIRFAASSTSDVFARASPALDQHWDYDLAADALPGSILQLEGIMRVVPDEEQTVLGAARAYVAYAFGFVEDEAEALEAEGRTEEAAFQRRRAVALYRRGRDLALHRLRLEESDFDEARAEPVQDYRAWLEDEFDDAEDAEVLFWAAYAWGSWVNAASPSAPHPDRAYAIATMRHSVALDPSYYGASGSIFLAFVATKAPGSTPERARAAWDLALDRSGRTNLLAQVTMARLHAVDTHDRALFVELLQEVLEAEDVAPSMRLSNQIAKRRAGRYLRQVDALFP